MAIAEVDKEKRTNCGKCIEACAFNAIASVNDKMLIFKQLCHSGAGSIKDALERLKTGELNETGSPDVGSKFGFGDNK